MGRESEELQWGLNLAVNVSRKKTPYKLLLGYKSNACVRNEIEVQSERDEQAVTRIKAQQSYEKRARYDLRHRRAPQ